METIEQVNEDFNEKKPKKTKLIVGIVLTLIVIAALIAYFCIVTKPQYVFDKAIDNFFTEEIKDFNSIKFNLNLKISAETDDAEVKTALEELKKCSIKTEVQLDINKKKEIFALGLKYGDEPVIGIQEYYNDGELYAYFNEIFDKYIKIDLNEEEKESFAEMFEMFATNRKQNATANKILIEELKKQIKKEGNFEKVSDEITIGEKDEKVAKHTLELSLEEMNSIISNICENLAENDEFLKCFDNFDGKELKEIAEEMKNDSLTDEGKIKISLYTRGILNKIVAVEFELDTEDENTGGLLVVKEKENMYSYKVNVKTNGANIQAIHGKVQLEEQKNKNSESGKITISMETSKLIADLKINLELNYSVDFDKEIDEINTNNSVKIEELTEEDYESIQNALKERPLIGDVISAAEGLQSNLEDDFSDQLDMEEDYDWQSDDFSYDF